MEASWRGIGQPFQQISLRGIVVWYYLVRLVFLVIFDCHFLQHVVGRHTLERKFNRSILPTGLTEKRVVTTGGLKQVRRKSILPTGLTHWGGSEIRNLLLGSDPKMETAYFGVSKKYSGEVILLAKLLIQFQHVSQASGGNQAVISQRLFCCNN